MMGLPVLDSADALKKIDISLCMLEEGMAKTPREARHARVIEAKVVLASILGHKPRPGLTARYVKVIERYEGGSLVGLQRGYAISSFIGGALEPIGGRQPILKRRFAIAARLVEASPEGAHQIYAAQGVAARGMRVAYVVLRELLQMPLRVFFSVTRLMRDQT